MAYRAALVAHVGIGGFRQLSAVALQYQIRVRSHHGAMTESEPHAKHQRENEQAGDGESIAVRHGRRILTAQCGQPSDQSQTLPIH